MIVFYVIECFHGYVNASYQNAGKLAYDRPLYARLKYMMDDMLGPSPMHIKYVSYVYDRLSI